MTHNHTPEDLNIHKYHFENFRGSHGLILYENLFQNKNSDFCAPLTSFDWNEVDPNLIGTSSIDTTCTIWGLETGQVSSYMFLLYLTESLCVCCLFPGSASLYIACLICVYTDHKVASQQWLANVVVQWLYFCVMVKFILSF